jgi:hypothetical protein
LLTAAEAEGLVSYSWNEGPEIPWWPAGPLPLVPGELGCTPRTLCYLTFNTDLAAELAGQGARALGADRPRAVPGRFGGGLEIGPDSSLSIELPARAR